VHFTLLGRVIEAVTGKPWRDEMAERVLKPAKLRRTTGYASRLYKDTNHAVPLERAESGWRPLILRKTDKTMHAAGGMGTSAVEGGRWLQLHLANGMLDGKRVLSAESARAMRTLQAKNDKPSGTIRKLEGYGCAWMVGSVNGHALAQHGGGYEGASAYVAMLPDDGVGIVVLINAGGIASRLGDIVAVDVIERLTGTKSAFDVYDRFTEQVRQMKEKRAAEAASAPPAAASLQLRQAASHYEGTYSNPWWGTLAVQDARGTLAFRLGDLVLAVQGAAEPDQFVVEEWLEEPTPAFFVVANGNDVEGVTLRHPKFGDVAFRR
jgi:CubicO group peptidase (beta-lactamase class C family)